MTRSEKDRKVIPVWPQLEATVPSEIVGSSSDCENRANEENKNKLFGNGKVVFGLVVSRNLTNRNGRYAGLIRPVSHDCGSFVQCGPTIMPHSPASAEIQIETFAEIQVENQTKLRTSGKRRDESSASQKFYISSDVSHTHGKFPIATAKDQAEPNSVKG